MPRGPSKLGSVIGAIDRRRDFLRFARVLPLLFWRFFACLATYPMNFSSNARTQRRWSSILRASSSSMPRVLARGLPDLRAPFCERSFGGHTFAAPPRSRHHGTEARSRKRLGEAKAYSAQLDWLETRLIAPLSKRQIAHVKNALVLRPRVDGLRSPSARAVCPLRMTETATRAGKFRKDAMKPEARCSRLMVIQLRLN